MNCRPTASVAKVGRRRGVCEKPLTVHYDGIVVGEFSCDMLVEEKVLIEIKANQCLVSANEVQLANYLTATEIETGLLLNFGTARLEFKRKARTYRQDKPTDEITL